MEVHLNFSVLLSFFFFVLMFLSIVWRSSSSKSSHTKLPPGPWKLPILGNLHQLGGSLPHHSLANLSKKYGPFMHLQLGELSNIIVNSPEMAKEVFKTNDLVFSNRPHVLAPHIMSYGSKDIVFAQHGSYWRELRKLSMTELLSTKRVQSFQYIREEEVSNLVKNVIAPSEGSTINLSEKLYSFTYGVTARAAFGKKSEEQEAFISIIEEVLKLAGGFHLVDLYPSIKVLQVISGIRAKLEKLHKGTDRILEKIVKDHRDSRTMKRSGDREADEDLVDVLLKLQEQKDMEIQLTDINIKAVILDIFSAGSDTSSTTMEWAMAEMMKNPNVMEKAQVEVRMAFDKKGYVGETDLHQLKYLRSVVKETLRLHPSAPLLVPRESMEKCQVGEYEIPAKTRLIVNAWAIGRDQKYWPEAERFLPERFIDSAVDYKGTNFEFIPFGAGRRICPGIAFAAANIELPLANLLYHFNWKLPDGMKQEELDMSESFGLTVRRKENLILVPYCYHP